MDAERGRIVADDHSEPVAPIIVMVQAATSLPVFQLAVPAGALADILNRRILLLITQLWMLAAAAALSVATYAGAMSPALFPLLTFLLGIGTAMNGPAWQATVTYLVAPQELSAAVVLNSAAFNVARAVGPASGSIILARTGAGTVFLLNALILYWSAYRSLSLEGDAKGEHTPG
jgi:MFS family permease